MSSASPLPSNRKLQKNNTRSVNLTRDEFQRLGRLASEAVLAVANFRPDKDKVVDLRKQYDPFYSFLKRHAQIKFEREFDDFLMFSLKIENIDFVNGSITVSFVHAVAKKDTRYKINFHNHLAPYSETWPAALVKAGGEGNARDYTFI